MNNPMESSLKIIDSKFHLLSEVIERLRVRNREVGVNVQQVPFQELLGWHFDGMTGDLIHDTGRFFSITGIRVMENVDHVRHWTQPIIYQPEVGYLGLICKEFGGVMFFLVQMKIEPGNINCVQLSPTLQATRSNYMRVHGGRKPTFLDYFQNAKPHQIIVDQLQSEQGARFLRKRNRNIIIKVDEPINLTEDFMWLTLGQIKRLMRMDNVVNMDLRTVISCLDVDGFSSVSIDEGRGRKSTDLILHWLSDLKSRYELLTDRIPLKEVHDGWQITDRQIVREDGLFFRVIGVKVTISNREVTNWCQPLVQPMHRGLCVLLCQRIDGVMHYLLQAKIECGNFDIVELAPTIQCLTGPYERPIGYVPEFLDDFLNDRLKGKFIFDTMQSEEGGRFFREQNRNVVYELDTSFQVDISDRFMWVTMPQIKDFLRYNNYLNIQVRSLIAAL